LQAGGFRDALFQGVLRPANPHLSIVHLDALDEEPQIGLAELAVAAPEPVAHGGGEGLDLARRDEAAGLVEPALGHGDEPHDLLAALLVPGKTVPEAVAVRHQTVLKGLVEARDHGVDLAQLLIEGLQSSLSRVAVVRNPLRETGDQLRDAIGR